MAYPINLFINNSALVFDWCTKADLANDYRVLDLQGQYFLIYNYKSATTEPAAWSYNNPDSNTIKPFWEPGKLKIKASVGADPATNISSIIVEMRIIDASTGNVITNGGPKQFFNNSVAFSPPAGTSQTWYVNFPASGTSYLDFLPGLQGTNFQHGKTYKAQLRFLGRNSSTVVISASDWVDTRHLLYVHTKGPVVSIQKPSFPPVTNNLNEIVVEEQSKVDIEFTTSVSSEVRVKTDYTYPYGTGYFTTTNSQLISSSGTQHKFTIQNPDTNNTNGVRFGIAARDVVYKNIGPCGWGLFNYNILFKKRTNIVPTINITGQTTVPASGGYYSDTGQFGFSGTHANAVTIKIEMWQNNVKKGEKQCNVSTTTWNGSFTELSLQEGTVTVKAIATSSTGAVAQDNWTGYILKKPVPIINSPISGTTITSTTLTATGDIANSIGNIKDSVVNVYLYKLQGTTRTEVARKQVALSSLSNAWTTTMTGLTNGEYVVKAIASNKINQENSTENSIYADLAAPSITVTSPNLNSYHKTTIMFLSGTCNKATTIKVEVWQNQIKQSETTASLVFEKTQWSAAIKELKNGKVSLKIIATNGVNNQTSTIWHSFYVDIEAPLIYLESVSGTNKDNVIENFTGAASIEVYSPTVTIASSAEDSLSGVKKYELYVNESLVDKVERNSAPVFSSASDIVLQEGQNKIEILYADALGNFDKFKIAGNSSFEIIYTPPNASGPVVTITSPRHGQLFNHKNIILNGTCSDTDGVQSITVDLYKFNTQQPYATIQNVTIDKMLGTWSCQLLDLVEGDIRIEAYGKDALGKVSDERATSAIRIDTIAPSVKIKEINPGLVSTSQNASVASYAVDNGSGLVKYIAKLENQDGNIQEIANVDIYGYPDSNENAPIISNITLERGNNVLHVFYYDDAGNVSTIATSINYSPIDKTPPVIEIKPAENTIIENLPLNCSVEINEPESELNICNVDFFPLTTIEQITGASQYYRLSTLPMAMLSPDLALPDFSAMRILEDNNNGSYMSAPPAQYFAGDFTIEAWVYVYEPVANHYLLSFGNTNGEDAVEVGLNYIKPGNISSQQPWVRITNQADTSNTVIAPTRLQNKRWAHLAFVLSGYQLSVFLNGDLWFSSTITRIPRGVTRNYCYIGRGQAAGSSSVGYYSNIRIWNIARSIEQIRENISTGLDTSNGLIASWRLNSEAENKTPDTSGNNHHGTLSYATIESIKTDTRRWALKLLQDSNKSLSYISLPELPVTASTGVTAEFVLLCQSKNTGGTLFFLTDVRRAAEIALVLRNDGHISLTIKNSSATKTISSTTALLLNQKTHIAFSISSTGSIKLYKNGETWGTGSGILSDFSASMAFMGKDASSYLTSQVVFYEFRLWATGKTQNDIKQNLNIALLPSTDLEAYYKVTDGVGEQIQDYSGNGNHGVIINSNYQWIRVASENLIDFYTIANPLEQFDQSHGTFFYQAFRINNQTPNLKTANTYNSDFVQSEHLVDGNHVIRVEAVNSANLKTTAMRTLVYDSFGKKGFYVVSVSPAANATLVALDTKLVINFSEPLAVDSALAAINNLIVVIDKGSNERATLSESTMELTNNNTQLSCQFVRALFPSTIYQIRILAAFPSAENKLLSEEFVSNFATDIEHSSELFVTGVSPADQSVDVPLDSALIINFSHPMSTEVGEINNKIVVLNEADFMLQELSLQTFRLSEDQKRLTCLFSTPLKANTRYKIQISAGLTSLDNFVLQENFVSYFTTKSETTLKNYTLPVFNGMNGLSIPLQPITEQYTNITLRKFLNDQLGSNSVGSIFWYDQIQKKWVGDILGNSLMKTFLWQDGCFVIFNSVHNKNISFSGTIIENGVTSITLKKGLNLIGIPLKLQNINNIKSLLAYISDVTGQDTIVSYMCRRKVISNSEEELFGYTYIKGEDSRNGTSFILDRLGGEAIAVVSTEDIKISIKGEAWED